ncbi:MAG: hypothetical protein KKC75_02470 [Nanoarchaeota archaeon]|nr:hypothetical protein [Nanoarchaeota archaeon]MBU1945730.1 hypothetical protein [Nanoarchaeota archaeon]
MAILVNSTSPIGHCGNGIKDFDEEDVDCGGSCRACVGCNNRIKDGNEEGVDCGVSCQNDCAKLKILAVPLRWSGSQDEFNNAVDTQLNFFIESIPLKVCPETIRVDKLDVNSYNFDSFSCSVRNCGVGAIKPFVESKGINVKDYDHIIGFVEDSPCSPTMGCSNGKDAAWVATTYEIVAAHEIGHFYGLEDEYCSNQAGSGDFRCNDGNGWWMFGFIPIPPMDKNYLDVDLGCNASIGDCCSDCSSNGNIFGTGDYFVCCEGNINGKGGRAIMSYANAQGPRDFDNHSKEHLATFEKLNCPQLLKSIGITSIVSGKIIDLNLKIYENNTVEEEYIHLIDGEPNTYYSQEGNYNITIYDANNNSLFNYSFEHYFGYEGPMVNDTDYNILNFTTFELGLKIPYDDSMKTIILQHDNKTIFNKTFNFCNEDFVCNGYETHLSCWQDCRPWSLDGLCINKSDGHCDPDCLEEVDPDCQPAFNITLISGWNLLSFPLNQLNKSINYVFNNINHSKIFSYNGTWLYYYNETNNNFNEINETKGYWVKSLNNQTLTLKGNNFSSPLNISLEQGWNLIGYPSLNTSNVTDFFKDANITTVFSYNGSWLSYNPSRNDSLNTLKQMKPGYGYWVKK